MRLPERVPGADAYMTRTRSIGVRYVNTWDTCTGPIGPRPRTGTRIPRTGTSGHKTAITRVRTRARPSVHVAVAARPLRHVCSQSTSHH